MTLTLVVVAVNFSVATTVFAYGLHARAGEEAFQGDYATSEWVETRGVRCPQRAARGRVVRLASPTVHSPLHATWST